MGFRLLELFKLADYYGEKHLKGRCEKQLQVLVTEDNVCQVYSASVQYDSKVRLLLPPFICLLTAL